MYTWVARDKGSEWRAIRELVAAGPLPFVPLIEAIDESLMPAPNKVAKTPREMIVTLARSVEALAGHSKVWVDFGNLTARYSPADVLTMMRMFTRAVTVNHERIVLVARCSGSNAISNACIEWGAQTDAGVALRMDGLTDLRQKAEWVGAIAATVPGRADSIDLIADAQDLPRIVTHAELADVVPLSAFTREYVFLAGTFPSGITHLSPDVYEHHLERAEWLSFEAQLGNAQWRSPSYGDYGTQAAVYEPSPPFRPSPSVRYTTGSEFVVLRGRRNVPEASKQYIGHARHLVRQAYFEDVGSNLGDSYVRRIARGDQRSGNPTTWRKAAIHRHTGVGAALTAIATVQYARHFARRR